MDPMDPVSATKDQQTFSPPEPMHRSAVSAKQEIAAWESLHRAEHRDVKQRYARFYTGGRVLLGALFLFSAYTKFFHFSDVVAGLQTVGFSSASVLVGLAAGVELVGGALLAGGYWVRIASGALIAYLVTTTMVLHWNLSDAANRDATLSHLGFIAALLLLAAHGAGGASLEKVLATRNEQPGTV